MKSKLLFFFLLPIIAIAQPAAHNDFKFHLNHIDICVDSVTYHSLATNKFISETFSYTKTFNDSTGSEFLVLGQEGYIHFLPDKGFYKNRIGACLLVHHSFKWKETDTLINYLQSFTKDSLYNRPYRSTEQIDYINVYENLNDTSSLLKFIPILSNGSKKTYISWGFSPADLEKGISQKKYMEDYVGKETRNKLFKNIQSIQVTTSGDEQKRIPALLKAYGYKRAGNKFLLEENPSVTMKPMKKNIRQTSVHIKLAKPAAKKIIKISNNALLLIDGDYALFTYKN